MVASMYKATHNSVWKYTRNARTDRYNFICSIDAHEKQQLSCVDDSSSGGGNAIPSNLTTEVLYSLRATFDLIDRRIKGYDQNYQALSNMYSEAMHHFKRKPKFNILNHVFIRK